MHLTTIPGSSYLLEVQTPRSTLPPLDENTAVKKADIFIYTDSRKMNVKNRPPRANLHPEKTVGNHLKYCRRIP
jgi:hypothetical protein